MSDVAAAALARNDRYLHEFVERYELCPFARRCRESGGLERRPIAIESLDLAPVLEIIDQLSVQAFSHVEIGLLIFPSLRVTFAEFEHFAVELRDARAKLEATPTFYVVPFHPDSPPDTDDPHRLVSLLRRSPDPTLQLVRASLLERVRGRNTEDTVWIDPQQVDFDAPPRKPPPSMSTRIAQTNFETVQRIGAHVLVELLESLRPR